MRIFDTEICLSDVEGADYTAAVREQSNSDNVKSRISSRKTFLAAPSVLDISGPQVLLNNKVALKKKQPKKSDSIR